MFGFSLSVLWFLIGASLVMLAIFDPFWFWSGLKRVFPSFTRVQRELRHGNLRILLALLGILIMVGQVRGAADAFFGSFAGQMIFLGASGLLIYLAFRSRPR